MVVITGFPDDDPFEDLRRLAEQLNDALGPQIEQYRQAFRMTEELSRQTSEAIEPIRRVSASLQAVADELTGPIGSMQRAVKQFQDLQVTPLVESSAAFRKDLQRFAGLGQIMADAMAPALSKSGVTRIDTVAIGNHLGQRLAALAEAQEAITVEAVAIATEESVAEGAPDVEASPLVWQTLLNIVISILLAWGIANPQLDLLELKIDSTRDALDRLRDEIGVRLDQSWRNTPTTHVTGRNLILHREPEAGSGVIRRIPKGSGVTVVDVHGKWFLVFDRDPRDGRTGMGWVYGRYLHPIEGQPKKVK